MIAHNAALEVSDHDDDDKGLSEEQETASQPAYIRLLATAILRLSADANRQLADSKDDRAGR